MSGHDAPGVGEFVGLHRSDSKGVTGSECLNGLAAGFGLFGFSTYKSPMAVFFG